MTRRQSEIGKGSKARERKTNNKKKKKERKQKKRKAIIGSFRWVASPADKDPH